MADNIETSKKNNMKKPSTFRIEPETAEKLRELCKEFPNQDLALNAIMAAYEREGVMAEMPQYAEDVKLFEQYKQLLSTKFMDTLKALSTADERARIEVQQLLDSKDTTIQDYQKRIEDIQGSKKIYEDMYRSAMEDKKTLEEQLAGEKSVNQSLRSEMEAKESQYNSSLQDKIQLNDILSRTIKEKEKELEQYKKYPDMMEERDAQIQSLQDRVRELEETAKENEYNHRLALLEKDKAAESDKAALRKSHEEQLGKLREKHDAEMEKLREKHDAEIEKLREKYEAAQSRIHELMSEK